MKGTANARLCSLTLSWLKFQIKVCDTLNAN